MLKKIRTAVVEQLWHEYHSTTPHINDIKAKLADQGLTNYPLDHFAIIDLPGPHSGIPTLRSIFEMLGFKVRGKGYLASKQNDFVWLAAEDSETLKAHEALPQVVVADFRLEEMPDNISAIISKYSEQTNPFPIEELQTLIMLAEQEEEEAAASTAIRLVSKYLKGRDWPAPTIEEFKTVQAFNELLAWVLVFGRRPNHFTLSVHLLNTFQNLEAFHDFIENDVRLNLNYDGGVIKGGKHTGISQGSTTGIAKEVQLADGKVAIPTGFVEFVWRYPTNENVKPSNWQDYYTDFIAQHANHVIESLYSQE